MNTAASGRHSLNKGKENVTKMLDNINLTWNNLEDLMSDKMFMQTESDLFNSLIGLSDCKPSQFFAFAHITSLNTGAQCYRSTHRTVNKIIFGKREGGGGNHGREIVYQTDELITGRVVTEGEGVEQLIVSNLRYTIPTRMFLRYTP